MTKYPLPSNIARWIDELGKPTPDYYRWSKQLNPEGGSGLPTGGTTAQVLQKASGTDGDAVWHTLVKGDVGLGSVDNTSDLGKPVSTATQTALNAKANTADLGSAAFVATTAFDAAGAATGAVATHAALTATHGATGAIVGTTNAQALTNKDLTSGNTFPTFNQNTTGSAAKLTTARTIDGQSFDGSANITVIAPGTHAATSKPTPVDADELSLVDSAASNVLKKLTWASLKATLKTYFDTLYAVIPTMGSWNAVLTFGGASTGVIYANNTCSYFKFYKLVVCVGTMQLSNKGSSTGAAQITGIPFASNSIISGVAVAYYSGLTGMTGALLLGLNVAATDKISITQTGATGASVISDTSFTSSGRIDFSFFYITP